MFYVVCAGKSARCCVSGSASAIIGIILGILFPIIAICVCICVCYRRKMYLKYYGNRVRTVQVVDIQHPGVAVVQSVPGGGAYPPQATLIGYGPNGPVQAPGYYPYYPQQPGAPGSYPQAQVGPDGQLYFFPPSAAGPYAQPPPQSAAGAQQASASVFASPGGAIPPPPSWQQPQQPAAQGVSGQPQFYPYPAPGGGNGGVMAGFSPSSGTAAAAGKTAYSDPYNPVKEKPYSL